jgi:hypothetical protein
VIEILPAPPDFDEDIPQAVNSGCRQIRILVIQQFSRDHIVTERPADQCIHRITHRFPLVAWNCRPQIQRLEFPARPRAMGATGQNSLT